MDIGPDFVSLFKKSRVPIARRCRFLETAVDGTLPIGWHEF
jgi:hypothetical protein